MVRAPSSEVDLRCGGQPMVLYSDLVVDGQPHPAHASGTLLGKRYADADSGLEVLCTKAGEAALSLGDEPLLVKDAKPLPSSDAERGAMHLSTLLEMAVDGFGDRVAFGPRHGGLTYAELGRRATEAAEVVRSRGVHRVGLVDVNSEAVPILVFGSALAGVAFVPLNYRLDDDHLRAVIGRTAPSLLVVDDTVVPRVGAVPMVELYYRRRGPAARSRRSPWTAVRCRPQIQTTPRRGCSPAEPLASRRRPCCATGTSLPM